MVKTSMDYRRAVVQNRIFHVRAVMRFPDGTEIVLTNADVGWADYQDWCIQYRQF